ncbi:MAG: helix-turn-helix domain-containing protein [Pseudomonadota bacterium]|nr:helix-turn-helix domain-containing protein [Pseudomonadota bacterium]
MPQSKPKKNKSNNISNDPSQRVQSRNRLLSDFTEDALNSYFKNLNGYKPSDIYKLVLNEVEPSIFRTVMDYTDGNQSVAADILGINRATLRKKLKYYQLHN